MLKKLFSGLFIFLLMVLLSISVQAKVPPLINYQALLTDANHNPIDGVHSIQFKLYKSATDGTPVWSETQKVTVTDGYFNVLLGSMNPIPSTAFDNNETFLELKVDDDPPMTPRKPFYSVGYALHANKADSLNNFAANDFVRKIGGVAAKNGNINLVEGQNISIKTDTDNGAITIGATNDAPGNLTLPYDGTISSSSTAFSVTNTGSGRAGYFKVDNSNSGATALTAYTSGAGYGMYCYAKTRYGLYARTGGDNGYAVYALANGDHAHGLVGSVSGESAYGVWGYSRSHYGVFGNTWYGIGGYFQASGTDAIGLYAKGGSNGNAAEFEGNVLIREHGTRTIVMELGKGLDYAEGFNVTDAARLIEPGAVLVIDPKNPGKLVLSAQPYDSKVAGIVAGANGLGSGVRLGAKQFDHDVALAGRVYCNVDATESAVMAGDLLTTAVTPGFAMKATDYDRARGAILGKAMQNLDKGQKGQILVLVTLQ